MKVLFTFAGLPHYYNFVLNRLNKIKGLEIVVVAPAAKGENVGAGVHETIEGLDFKLYRLEEYKTLYGKTFLKNFLSIINKEKPDIVVTIWPYVLKFIFSMKLLLTIKSRGIKLLYKEIPFRVPKYKESLKYYLNQDHPDENLKSQRSKNKLINFFQAAFLTQSRRAFYHLIDAHVNYIDDAYEIIGSYGIDKERIFVTYNSPDTDILFKAKKEIQGVDPILPPNDYRIIHVGRLVQWKRVDMLIKVFARLKQKYTKAELVVVGSGPQENELKNFVQELKLDKSVIFTGAIYDPVLLGKYLSSSALYVLAGMGGLSINEAMVYDLPVICSIADGTEKKLVRENYNGKYFEEGNEEDLYSKIDSLLSDVDALKRMGENSGRIIREEVNINTVIEGYIKAFNYVTKNRYNLEYHINEAAVKNIA